MQKRLELMIRLVDGGILYWDASVALDSLSPDEIMALMPTHITPERVPPEVKATMQSQVKNKFQEAASSLWEKVLQRAR